MSRRQVRLRAQSFREMVGELVDLLLDHPEWSGDEVNLSIDGHDEAMTVVGVDGDEGVPTIYGFVQ